MYRYEVLKMRSIMVSRHPYGILCKEKENDRWVTVAVAAPFSNSLEAVSQLAEKCTALQLCPEQMLDVVVDFIVQTDIGL